MADETTARVMAKVFDVEGSEKGSGLQSRINAFTAGKAIGEVYDFTLEQSNGEGGPQTKAVLTYEALPGEPSDRVLSKVVEGAHLGESDLQTKINAFSKGKSIDVRKVAAGKAADGTALIVIFYTKEGGDEGE